MSNKAKDLAISFVLLLSPAGIIRIYVYFVVVVVVERILWRLVECCCDKLLGSGKFATVISRPPHYSKYEFTMLTRRYRILLSYLLQATTGSLSVFIRLYEWVVYYIHLRLIGINSPWARLCELWILESSIPRSRTTIQTVLCWW